MINLVSATSIKQRCLNGIKHAGSTAKNIYTNAKTNLKPKVDEFIKTSKEKPLKTAAGTALTFGALMLAGKCLKETKDKIVEAKNK